MRKILMTGACGFIGSNMVHYWNKKYPQDEVIILDNLSEGSDLLNIIGSKSKLVKGSICNLDLVKHVLIDNEIDGIIHFAAASHVDRSISNPSYFIENNVVGTQTLLEAVRFFNFGGGKNVRLHSISTDEVYGSLSLTDERFTEETSYKPNSPYSASKAGANHVVRAYYHTYGLNVVTTNCSNNYGPRQALEKLIPLLIANALSEKSLPIYGNGTNIRDWLYVEDHCEAIDLVFHKAKAGETYNIGGNCELTNLEVVYHICEQLSKFTDKNESFYQSLIAFVQDRPGHDFRYAVNSEKIKRDLGWEPKTDFLTGLGKTIKYYLDT